MRGGFSFIHKMNKENFPKHIAIVPDGNRRWAKKKGLNPWQGHLEGAGRTEELIQISFDLKIKCLSIWGGSLNNLTKRSEKEVKVLFKIYEKYFKKLIKKKEIHQNKVKVNIIGRWSEILPKKSVETIKELIKVTKDYDQYFLNFLIGYNGTDEMLTAIRDIAKKARKDKNLKITEKTLENNLWSGHLPPVDFLIRTGSKGDPHNSVGFMMWYCANSQLYFTDTTYPDFGKKEFNKAINDFVRRQRRFGK